MLDRRVRLPVAEPYLGEEELSYVTECVITGWVSSAGRFVTKFEEMFAAFCGTEYALATSNGTTALHLALLALDIGPGDEVLVPALTFIATANAVTYTGATPIFIDSEPDTWNMDPSALEAVITSRTKAIIPVHLYGHPADMDSIMAVARRHGLHVVEDAAEALGARHRGAVVGGLGDLGTFSFYGNKIITTGEGGMVVTNRGDLAAKMRQLRDHGMDPDRRYWHSVLGYNYRLTNIQAALGVGQLEKIDGILANKQRIAQLYAAGLGDVPGDTLPPQAPWATNVYWLYSILIQPERFGRDRDDLIAYLKSRGIDTRPLFPPLHQQPIYATGQRLPVSEHLSSVGISLPSAVTLTGADVHRIIEEIRHAAR